MCQEASGEGRVPVGTGGVSSCNRLCCHRPQGDGPPTSAVGATGRWQQRGESPMAASSRSDHSPLAWCGCQKELPREPPARTCVSPRWSRPPAVEHRTRPVGEGLCGGPRAGRWAQRWPGHGGEGSPVFAQWASPLQVDSVRPPFSGALPTTQASSGRRLDPSCRLPAARVEPGVRVDCTRTKVEAPTLGTRGPCMKHVQAGFLRVFRKRS